MNNNEMLCPFCGSPIVHRESDDPQFYFECSNRIYCGIHFNVYAASEEIAFMRLNARADKAAPVERIFPRDGHGDIIDQDQFYDHCNKCTDTMSDIEVLRERLKIEGDIAEKMFNALNDIIHSAFEHGNENLSGKTLDPDGELLFAGEEAARAYLKLQGVIR